MNTSLSNRPWYHRSWIFPRDPDFAAKAGRILDLYVRQWQGTPLKDDEFVISADEKTSIQARRRKHTTQRCRPRTPMHVEHEYFRCGAWTYIAALDVHRARVFGRCETKNGIAPFNRLVEQVMTRPPYNDARRVFWIVDNCSAHRGASAAERLKMLYPRLTLVHAPVHASCLTRSKSTSPSSSGRSSRPMIFPTSTLSPSAFWTFNTTGQQRRAPSNGSSLARTSTNSSSSSAPHADPLKIR